jgi:hypothetical protein
MQSALRSEPETAATRRRSMKGEKVTTGVWVEGVLYPGGDDVETQPVGVMHEPTVAVQSAGGTKPHAGEHGAR